MDHKVLGAQWPFDWGDLGEVGKEPQKNKEENWFLAG